MNAPRAKRDPEGRRRVIIEAAAELIVEVGLNGVTHRKVAERAGVPLGSTTQYFASLDELLSLALEELSCATNGVLVELAADLETSADRPLTLAKMLKEYLSDTGRMRAEIAFHIAHVENPQLQMLSGRWYDGLMAELGKYTDERSARSVALYTDGVLMHSALIGELPEEDELRDSIAKLMGR